MKGAPDRVDLSTDHRYAAAAAGVGLMIVDVEKGARVSEPMHHAGEVTDIDMSPAGDLIASCSRDMTVRLWHVPSGKPSGLELKHDAPVMHVEFSPDGSQLLTASVDGITRLWSLAKTAGARDRLLANVIEAAITPDGSQVVASFTDKHTRILDAESLKRTGREIHHTHTPRYLDVGADGRRVVVSSGRDRDATVEVWDLDEEKARTLENLGVDPHDICLSPHSNFAIYMYSVLLGIQPLDGVSPRIHSNHNVQWNSRVHPSRRGIVFLPDESRFYTGTKYSITEYSPGQEDYTNTARIASVTESSVNPVTISRDGKLLAVAPGNNLVRILATESLEVLEEFRAPGVWALEFSPDGTRLAIASQREYARIFDVASGQPDSSPMRHQHAVEFATFDSVTADVSGGGRLATADASGSVRIWETDEFMAVAPPLWHGSKITRLQFFPDGQRILTTTEDGFLTIWKLPEPTTLPREECSRLVRFLSRRQYDQSGDLKHLSNSDLAVEWEALRDDHPDWFSVTSQEVRAWREQQIAVAIANNHLYAEQFHRGYLQDGAQKSAPPEP